MKNHNYSEKLNLLVWKLIIYEVLKIIMLVTKRHKWDFKPPKIDKCHDIKGKKFNLSQKTIANCMLKQSFKLSDLIIFRVSSQVISTSP